MLPISIGPEGKKIRMHKHLSPRIHKLQQTTVAVNLSFLKTLVGFSIAEVTIHHIRTPTVVSVDLNGKHTSE